VGGNYIGSFLPGPAGYTFIPSGLNINEGFNSAASNAFRQTVLGAPGFGFLRPMNAGQKTDTTYWGINAELNWTTGIGQLTVIPAYRESKDRSFFYGPGFNTANTNEDINQFSFETRLAGTAGTFDYVVGAYYFNEKIKANNQYNQEFVLPIVTFGHKTESWAAFGQATANLADRFRLIGGARYTHDNKSIDGVINNFITFCGGLPPALLTPPASFGKGCAAPNGLPRYPNFLSTGDTVNWLKTNGWIANSFTNQANTQVFPLLNGVGAILKTHVPNVASGTFSRITWKVSAEFDLSPSSMIYATAESGYHSGGFQMAEGRPRYRPEYITAYSIGSKNRFLDNKLQANFEAFVWKYKDQQITYFTVDTSGTLINSNENAGRATIKGFDIDLIGKPTSNTTLSAKVQYLDAKYDDLHLFTAAPRDNFACPFTLTGQLAGGAPVKDFDCSGKTMLFSPKWTVNLGVEQVVPVGDSLELVGTVNTAWRDKQFGAFEYLPFELIPSYWTTDLNLTLRNRDGGWSVSGYVLNLEDKRRNLAPQSSPIGVAVGHYTAPLTYGLRVSAEF
jgi:iron complex outermembrane receptor protein